MAGDAGPAAVTIHETDEPGPKDNVVQQTRWWHAIVGSPVRLGLTAGLIAVTVLLALDGWLAHRADQEHRQVLERTAFLEAGRQAALDLTSVEYTRVEADVQRILAASTGSFRADFERRSPPFVEEVLRTKSTSVGQIVEAAVESVAGEQAKVIVAVKVTTTRDGSSDQRVKSWRMRVYVSRTGAGFKVSNVEMIS